jgi:two-component system, OmpR family, phosphate regulon sensor histidine kinase PhoR
MIIVFILMNLIFIFSAGRKRRRELEAISDIIKGIRQNSYKSGNEIKLYRQLENLEKEIVLMFEKNRGDIEYLKKLEKMRTEFIGNVSHEIRTPLFTIHGYLETLLDGALEDQKVNRSFIEKANNHTLNLNNLLSDLIDISMIESGEMRMSLRYFRINEYLQTLLEEYIGYAAEKGLKLSFTPCRNNLELFGDKVRLRQVMVNLLTNAIKYTEKGEIEIFVEETSNQGRIVVKDTGIGIPSGELNRIFERFYRVDKARSREVGGTGLGLAIVKHILEAHNSHLEVKSEAGKGTEFSFLLKK